MIVTKSTNFDDVFTKLKSDGLSSLFVISDFDRTLTYGSKDGVKLPSIITLLRDGNHLSKDYADKAHALCLQYESLISDSAISKSEKKLLMKEWWERHNELLINSGLSIFDLEDIVKNGKISLRDGIEDMLSLLRSHSIPLIIFSASGCGDAIPMFFNTLQKKYPNMYYIANEFEWDIQGFARSTKGQLIHSANKDEAKLADLPSLYKAVNGKKNALLMGDHIDDLDMQQPFNLKNVLKVGFFNFCCNSNKEDFIDNFDLIIEGDGDLKPINRLLKSLA